MATNLFRQNDFNIVGTLKNVDIRYGIKKSDGKDFISGTLIVGSKINGVDNEFHVNIFENKTKADGSDYQIYVTYSKLPELINKKIQITGNLRENRFWSSATGQLATSQQLNGRFIKGVGNDVEDEATFTVGGFIARKPVEKMNKAGECYRYDIAIGQSNYNGDNMSIYTCHIKPEDREILKFFQDTEVGTTLRISGDLMFTVTTVSVEDTNTAVGKPLIRTFTNRQSNYYINSVSNPITDETAYNGEVVSALVEAYKEGGLGIEARAKDNSAPATSPAPAAAPVVKKQTSLI